MVELRGDIMWQIINLNNSNDSDDQCIIKIKAVTGRYPGQWRGWFKLSKIKVFKIRNWSHLTLLLNVFVKHLH